MTATAPADPEGPDRPLARIDSALVRLHRWVLERWPASLRRRLALVGVVLAITLVAVSWTGKVVGWVVDLELLGHLGLMVVCWVGAGGALLPVPGVRPLSWFMIVQQGAILNPVLVATTSALAMALGQSSYFLAARSQRRRHAGATAGHAAHHPGSVHPDRPPGSGGSVAAGAAAPASPSQRLVARSRAIVLRARAAVSQRMGHHPQRIVFVLCVVPNPLTTFATMSAAAIGLPFRRFFIASLGGFLVLTSALVIAGQAILAAIGVT